MKYHPACAIFPLIEGAEFDKLVEDIRLHGLREKILLDEDGSILDGRNRYRACQEIGIEPRTTVWRRRAGDSAIALVVSLNIRRRHLTPSLKASLAEELEPLFAEEAKQRQRAAGKEHGRGQPPSKKVPQKVGEPKKHSGEASAQAAKATGANRQYVADLKKLKKAAPDLHARVKAGELTIQQAKQMHDNRKRAARREENEERIKDAPPAQTLADLVASAARFSSIVIDPPWSPEDSGIQSVFGRSEPDYATMPLAKIAAQPVGELADADCHLYLWATHRTLPLAFGLIDKWGFRYVTALAWVKPHFGMGNYFRGQHEHVLFAVKGSLALKRKDAGTVFYAPAGTAHSEKPQEFFTLVESCSHAPYLELFGRRERPGWTVWGQDGLTT